MLRYALIDTSTRREFASATMMDWSHRWGWISRMIAARCDIDPDDVRAIEGDDGEDFICGPDGAPIAELTFKLVTP